MPLCFGGLSFSFALFRFTLLCHTSFGSGPGAVLYLFCAILYQLLLLGPMAWPVYRLARQWLRTSSLSLSDALILSGWAAGAIAISFLLAVMLCRHSLHSLRK